MRFEHVLQIHTVTMQERARDAQLTLAANSPDAEISLTIDVTKAEKLQGLSVGSTIRIVVEKEEPSKLVRA